jgi:putative addiction module CopG family antidote
MSTLSVPLTPELEKFINARVKEGRAANKAEVARQALTLLKDEEVVAAVLRAQQEPTLRGDLRELAKQFK